MRKAGAPARKSRSMRVARTTIASAVGIASASVVAFTSVSIVTL
jgi:hypothetical protein